MVVGWVGGKGLQRKLRKNKTEENNTDFDRLDRWVGVDPYAGRRIKTKRKTQTKFKKKAGKNML